MEQMSDLLMYLLSIFHAFAYRKQRANEGSHNGSEPMQRPLQLTSKCINTHQRNSSNSSKTYFSIFLHFRLSIVEANGKNGNSPISNKWYFLFELFCVCAVGTEKWEKVRKYLLLFFSRRNERKVLGKLPFFIIWLISPLVNCVVRD